MGTADAGEVNAHDGGADCSAFGYDFSISPRVAVIKYPQEEDLGCHLCVGERFQDHRGLRRHLISHKIDVQYGCRKCHRMGDSIRSIASHYVKCKTKIGNSSVPKQHQCDECGERFETAIGLGQHVRHRHPAACNARRTIPRPKKAGAVQPSKRIQVWSSEEIERLSRLESEFAGERNINLLIREHLPGKTNKQISDKRRELRGRQRNRQSHATVDEARVTEQTPAQRVAPPQHCWTWGTRTYDKEAFRNAFDEGFPASPQINEHLRCARRTLRAYMEGVIDENEMLEKNETILQALRDRVSLVPTARREPRPAGRIPTEKRAGQRKVSKMYARRKSEYKRVQRLFEFKTGKLATEIITGQVPAKCEIPTEEVERTYREKLEQESPECHLDPDTYWLEGEPSEFRATLKPFTAEEVMKAYGSTKKSSAPGPDGLKLGTIRDFDPKGETLAALFSCWALSGRVPDSLKGNRSLLIPKGNEDLHKIGNWRPLTISSMILRLFTKLLSKRLMDDMIICPRQRGFIRAAGCYENLTALSSMIEHGKRRNGIAVTFLDLAKAFDTVSHHHIEVALKRHGVPKIVGDLILNLYSNASTSFCVNGDQTAGIAILRGVKQGDPLSSWLFNLCMDPLLKRLEESGAGYQFGSSPEARVASLAFADDIALTSPSDGEMRKLLAIVDDFCSDTGLRLNVRKCATFCIKPVAGGKSWALDTNLEIRIGGEMIPRVDPGEVTKYLGMRIGAYPVEGNIEGKLADMIARIDKYPLKPSQKLEILQKYCLPKLYYTLGANSYSGNCLRGLDVRIKRTVKEWLKLPSSTPDGLLYASIGNGGLGLPLLRWTALEANIKRLSKVVGSKDPVIQELAKHTGLDQILAKKRRALGDRPGRWRHRVLKQWQSLRLAGSGIEEFSSNPNSNSWLDRRGDGRVLKEGEWLTALKLRAGNFPTRAAMSIVDRTRNKSCRRCSCPNETLGHILGQCPFVKGKRIKRHDHIVNLVSDEIKKSHPPGCVRTWSEPTLRDGEGNNWRPDLVVSIPAGTYIVDVTVRYEGDGGRLHAAYQEKERKYQCIRSAAADLCATPTDSVTVVPIVLGSRGAIPQFTTEALTILGLKRRGFWRCLARRALLTSLDMLRIFGGDPYRKICPRSGARARP